MIISKVITFVWFLVACTVNIAHAAYPEVIETDFNGKQGVIVISNDSNEKYLAVLAEKEIVIEQIQYKKQKSLSLKSKKILLQYLRKKYKPEEILELKGFMPVKYWEKGKRSYLISIINNKGIKAISPSIFPVSVPVTQKDEDEKRPQGIEVLEEQSQRGTKVNVLQDDVALSVNELKSLYMKALEKGDIKESQRYFKEIKAKNEN